MAERDVEILIRRRNEPGESEDRLAYIAAAARARREGSRVEAALFELLADDEGEAA